MNKRIAKLISIVTAIAIMISVTIFTRLTVSGASGHLLYWNDRSWVRESRQGIEYIDGIYYIPITLLHQLDNVEVQTNDYYKIFYIKVGENGEKLLSFDTQSNFALTHERTRIYIRTYYLHGDHYVPARGVCEFLGINYEQITSPITGEVAIRVTDGSEKSTFEDLLKSKYPGFFPIETESETSTVPPVTDTTAPPVSDTTAPPITTPPPVLLTDRTIYLTFEDSLSRYTDDILELLDDYGYKGTFFVTGKAVKSDPTALSRIVAEGHTIGLHTMQHVQSQLNSVDAILADIKEQNELLSALIKQKSHIWRAPEGSAKLPILNAKAKQTIADEGYLISDFNLEATGWSNANAANKVINGIKKNEVCVIRFVENESTVAILSRVLDFIKENADVCEVRVVSPAYGELN